MPKIGKFGEFNLQAFVNAAKELKNAGKENAGLKLGSSTLHVVGRFNRASTIASTREAFVSALKAEFGHCVPDDVLNRLAGGCGKPLTVRTIINANKMANEYTARQRLDMLLSTESGSGPSPLEMLVDAHLSADEKWLEVIGGQPAKLNDGQIKAYRNAFVASVRQRIDSYKEDPEYLARYTKRHQFDSGLFVQNAIQASGFPTCHLDAAVKYADSPKLFNRYLELAVFLGGQNDWAVRLLDDMQATCPQALDSSESFWGEVKRRVEVKVETGQLGTARLVGTELTAEERQLSLATRKRLATSLCGFQRRCASLLADQKCRNSLAVEIKGCLNRLKDLGLEFPDTVDTMNAVYLQLRNRCMTFVRMDLRPEEILAACVQAVLNLKSEAYIKDFQGTYPNASPTDVKPFPERISAKDVAGLDRHRLNGIELNLKARIETSMRESQELSRLRNNALGNLRADVGTMLQDFARELGLEEELGLDMIDLTHMTKHLEKTTTPGDLSDEKVLDYFMRRHGNGLKELCRALKEDTSLTAQERGAILKEALAVPFSLTILGHSMLKGLAKIVDNPLQGLHRPESQDELQPFYRRLFEKLGQIVDDVMEATRTIIKGLSLDQRIEGYDADDMRIMLNCMCSALKVRFPEIGQLPGMMLKNHEEEYGMYLDFARLGKSNMVIDSLPNKHTWTLADVIFRTLGRSA